MAASVIRIEPAMSTPPARPMPSFSSISTQPSRKASAPMGTLTKKIQCQSSDCVRAPPASSPIEPPPADALEKASGRAKWGFSPAGKVLLVFGGSQGSAAMNHVVAAWIDRGLPRDLSVIWATGKANYEKLAHYDSAQVKVRAYIAPISEAYRAADFALSRGGAMATAELCAWGIPAIVVPLPTAAADHQTANAKALAAAGAAEMIRQSELNVDRLSQTVEALLADPSRLTSMRRKALERARPTAAADIASHVIALIGRAQMGR